MESGRREATGPECPRDPESEKRISLLALRYRRGERDALGALYAELEGLIHAFLRPHRQSLPPGLEVEDLHQQAYVALAEAALEWKPERRDNFMPYFLSSFPWRIHRYLRSQTPSRRTTRFQLRSLPHDALMEQVAQTPGNDGRDWDDVLMCADLVRRLPGLQRQVVRLHLYHGLPFAEVAVAMGIGRSAAHEAFGRAVSLLRSFLAEPAAGSGGDRRRTDPRRKGVDPAVLRRGVETMHRLARPGSPLPGRETLRREAGLTWREYEEIMARLRARGCVVDRRPGHPGSLACSGPEETMRRLEEP